MKHRKPGGDTKTLVKSTFTGFGFGLLVMAALCLLAAVCVHLEKLPEQAIPYCAWAICTLGAAAGCTAAQRLAGKAHLTVGLGCGLLTALTVGAMHAVLARGEGAAWRCAAICLLAAVVTALVHALRRKGR